MATKYIVTPTTDHPEKPFSRKEYAIAEADRRADELGHAEPVTVTTGTGKTVHTTEVIEPETTEVAATGAGQRGKRRSALRPAALPGWEVLYDKPRQQAEVWRAADSEGYALYCTAHEYLHPVDRLADERTARREGDWCNGCNGNQVKEDAAINEVSGVITSAHLNALEAMHIAATATAVWDPEAAAGAVDTAELEALGLVETVTLHDDDDQVHVWAYLTDKGDLARSA